MGRIITYEKVLSFSKIVVQVIRVGNDYSITVTGGEKPHIGCTTIAIPRPSLLNDGSMSATVSVVNVTGHKDDVICSYIAEKVCKKTNGIVVCTGGFHIDNITQEEIREVIKAVEELEKNIIGVT